MRHVFSRVVLMTLAVMQAPVSAAEATVPIEPRRISEHVWFVQGQSGMISTANQGFNSNAAFVVTNAGVVLFDALGTPALGRELRRKIADITDQPVVKVVVSHYHADHFYGVMPFHAAGATVIANQAVKHYLATSAPSERLIERRQSLAPWVDENTRVIPPDRYQQADEQFELGGVQFSLRAVGPGHTPEDLIMRVEPDGVLMVGDLMVSGRLPFVGDADTGSWLQAIESVSSQLPRIIVPGHGGYSTDPVRDLDLTRNYLKFLREKMAQAAENLLSFDEAYAETDWSSFAALPAFEQANRNNAYQVFLDMQGQSLEAASGHSK